MSVFYFNRTPIQGPWGGGNKTLTAIVNRLTAMGHEVVSEYRQDIEKIFCVDPRPNSAGVGYEHLRAFADRMGIPIIQRVGDVGTHGKPDLTALVARSVMMSESVIFTSEWARMRLGVQPKRYSVIANGALPVFFERRRGQTPPASTPRVVTHHWSNNSMKGLDLYERLCADIDQGRVNFDFTYIGRSSHALSSRTTPPMDEFELSRALPQFDIYLSASREEAGANHIVEAMACGLPVVYSEQGGSIPEYCGKIGASFGDYQEMLAALNSVVEQYDQMLRSSFGYSRTMNEVVDEYVEILCKR